MSRVVVFGLLAETRQAALTQSIHEIKTNIEKVPKAHTLSYVGRWAALARISSSLSSRAFFRVIATTYVTNLDNRTAVVYLILQYNGLYRLRRLLLICLGWIHAVYSRVAQIWITPVLSFRMYYTSNASCVYAYSNWSFSVQNTCLDPN